MAAVDNELELSVISIQCPIQSTIYVHRQETQLGNVDGMENAASSMLMVLQTACSMGHVTLPLDATAKRAATVPRGLSQPRKCVPFSASFSTEETIRCDHWEKMFLVGLHPWCTPYYDWCL